MVLKSSHKSINAQSDGNSRTSINMENIELSNLEQKDDRDVPDGPICEDEEEILQEEHFIDVEIDDKVSKKMSNTYAAKKTVAQGMMDIALITANANQLRYLIEFNRNSSTFYVNAILIAVSLLLQVGIGVALIFKGRLDLKGMSKEKSAKTINNHVVVGIFLVTIINVFVATFTVTGHGNGSNGVN
ncbi:ninjurin-B-like isoform X2 [Onthophagus taurus]|uniref:ninjurin-B-like isoform X2 n=1 Tax=Onthophagus taurus TaxID=166361 RepID=UPI0039BE7B6E